MLLYSVYLNTKIFIRTIYTGFVSQPISVKYNGSAKSISNIYRLSAKCFVGYSQLSAKFSLSACVYDRASYSNMKLSQRNS